MKLAIMPKHTEKRKRPKKLVKLAGLKSPFSNLRNTVRKLRGPGGCPWDQAQTAQSLTPYIVEEAYELVEAIETGTREEQIDELADFLFQAFLQAQVAEDQGLFNIEEVMKHLDQKLKDRHPHVFGKAQDQLQTSEQVWKQWHAKKQKLKKGIQVPLSLPSLQASFKIDVKSAGYEFDWKTPAEVEKKVREEWLELKEEIRNARGNLKNRAKIEDEMGDLLFSVAQWARHLEIDPETALRNANRKFMKRFELLLNHLEKKNRILTQLSAREKNSAWKLVKSQAARLNSNPPKLQNPRKKK